MSRKQVYVIEDEITSVGLRRSNDFGLNDMIGNASEWCNDYYGEYSDSDQIDPVRVDNSEAMVSKLGELIKASRGPSYPKELDLMSVSRYVVPSGQRTGRGIRVVLPIK